jgi:hypothetical protein
MALYAARCCEYILHGVSHDINANSCRSLVKLAAGYVICHDHDETEDVIYWLCSAAEVEASSHFLIKIKI